MFIFTMRIYKFFADLRNVPRIVAIQIVIYYYMSADRVRGLFVHRALLSSCLVTGSIHMAAAVGRCPLAQVLRNSLPGHPPVPMLTL